MEAARPPSQRSIDDALDLAKSPAAIGLGAFGGLLLIVIGLAVVRGPYGGAPGSGPAASASADAGRSARPAASTEPEAEPSGDPVSISPGPSAKPAHAKPSTAEAADQLGAFRERWKVRDARGSLAALEKLAEIDKELFRDSDLKSDIVDLTQLAAKTPGLEGRMFALLTEKAAPYGLDVLLYLVTNRGGSQAADTADKLLSQPDVLARGSKAMQIAFLLRKAPCEKKKDLFARAGTDGDERTLGQLQVLTKSSCRGRSVCCFEHGPEVDAAMGAIEARVGR